MLDWEMAEGHLYDTKIAYESIGFEGSFALALTINPLAKRYESGERTIELYNEILELQ